MKLKYFVLLSVCYIISSTLATDDCPTPVIENGKVAGKKLDNFFSGQVKCDVGFHLVGSQSIKCRHGTWSSAIPVCSAIGSCPELPRNIIQKGRVIPIRGSRNSAYKFKCRQGYTLIGERKTFCQGDAWSHTNLPVCARAGCEESNMLNIQYGESRMILRGAVIRYKCDEGATLEGGNFIYCDGQKWNNTLPTCLVAPEIPLMRILYEDGSPALTPLVGDKVQVHCQGISVPVPQIEMFVPDHHSMPENMNSSNIITITLSEEDHGQEVSCSAVNKVGSATNQITLSAFSIPVSTVISGPSLVYSDGEFEYNCLVQGGNPKPDIEWEVTDVFGNQIHKNIQITGAHMKLTPDISNTVNLEIICKTENIVGATLDTLNVTFAMGPKSSHITGPTLIVPNKEAKYVCDVEEGNPDSVIEWEVIDMMGNSLSLNFEIVDAEMVLKPSNLLIENLDIVCTAENIGGSVSSEMHVDVASGPLSTSISGPSTVFQGGMFEFNCDVDGGNPNPVIKMDIFNNLGNQLEDEVETDGSRLQLKLNSANYGYLDINCHAQNVAGEVTNSIRIYTTYLPTDLEIDAPSEVYPGDSPKLTCKSKKTEQFPSAIPATYKWNLEGLVGKLVELEEQGEAQLIVTETEEKSVMYIQCTATVEGLEDIVKSPIVEMIVNVHADNVSTIVFPPIVRLEPSEQNETAFGEEDLQHYKNYETEFNYENTENKTNVHVPNVEGQRLVESNQDSIVSDEEIPDTEVKKDMKMYEDLSQKEAIDKMTIEEPTRAENVLDNTNLKQIKGKKSDLDISDRSLKMLSSGGSNINIIVKPVVIITLIFLLK